MSRPFFINMGKSSSLAFVLGIFLLFSPSPAPAATVSFSIGLGYVLDASGGKIGTSALFQLIDLGADGVFNPITEESWTGGDDVLLSQPFSNADAWASTAAFDLINGTGKAGEFSRQFTLTLGAEVYTGQKIGIRWFPTVRAADFAVSTPALGLPFGQFTRQGTPLHGGTDWVIPSEGDLVSFDPLVTAGYDPVNGRDPNAAGRTSFVIPEPRFALLAVIGLAQIFGWRNRPGFRSETANS